MVTKVRDRSGASSLFVHCAVIFCHLILPLLREFVTTLSIASAYLSWYMVPVCAGYMGLRVRGIWVWMLGYMGPLYPCTHVPLYPSDPSTTPFPPTFPTSFLNSVRRKKSLETLEVGDSGCLL